MSAVIAAIVSAAKAVGVPPMLLLSICYAESNFRYSYPPYRMDNGSRSYSVCQVKENTARMFNKRVRPQDLYSARGSAHYAALYLRYQLERYDGDWQLATAAFNAGSASLDSFGNTSNTRYVSKVFVNLENEPWKAKKKWSLHRKTLIASSTNLSKD